MYGVGLVCLEYNRLYKQYLQTCNPVDWHIATTHRRTCPTCRNETGLLTEQASKAVHPPMKMKEDE